MVKVDKPTALSWDCVGVIVMVIGWPGGQGHRVSGTSLPQTAWGYGSPGVWGHCPHWCRQLDPGRQVQRAPRPPLSPAFWEKGALAAWLGEAFELHFSPR